MSGTSSPLTSVLDQLTALGHKKVVFCNDPDTGLKAIIAIHDTTLGPALGGTRMWNYETEEEALEDVLRLSRGMTYKAAISGLNLGGGKAVIIGDSRKGKSEAMMRSYGRFIKNLNGEFITAEDVGTTTNMLPVFLNPSAAPEIPLHTPLKACTSASKPVLKKFLEQICSLAVPWLCRGSVM
jgi:leucine dehydrogenase